MYVTHDLIMQSGDKAPRILSFVRCCWPTGTHATDENFVEDGMSANKRVCAMYAYVTRIVASLFVVENCRSPCLLVPQEEITEDDMVEEYDGFKCVIDPKSVLYLYGLELDFSDALIGGGFQFQNPNAESSCGCGKSFGV